MCGERGFESQGNKQFDVNGISTKASCLSTLAEDASGEDDVAGYVPASGPLDYKQ